MQVKVVGYSTEKQQGLWPKEESNGLTQNRIAKHNLKAFGQNTDPHERSRQNLVTDVAILGFKFQCIFLLELSVLEAESCAKSQKHSVNWVFASM